MSNLTLIIDGYNLLNVTGLPGYGTGTALARARRALLGFLAGTLDDATRATTAIVFDAGDVPPHLDRQFVVASMQVYFARDFADADEMIESLIRANDAPRRLTVVSSDHRIQRAARRRRASAVDSEPWYAGLRRPVEPHAPSTGARKPEPPLSPDETQAWFDFFGRQVLEASHELAEQFANLEIPDPPRDVDAKSETRSDAAESSSDQPAESATKDGVPLDPSLANPFPPGYGTKRVVPPEGPPPQKLPAKKLPAKKLPAKKLPAKKLPAKKLPAKKLPAPRAPETTPDRSTDSNASPTPPVEPAEELLDEDARWPFDFSPEDVAREIQDDPDRED